MIKLLGILVLSVAVIMIGFLKCLKLNNRVRYLNSVKQFAFSCADDMRFNQKGVFKLFENYGNNELEFLKELDANSLNDDKKLVELLEQNGIFEADIKTFCAFLQGLGTSDIEGQRLHCEYYYKCFCNLLNEADNDKTEKGRIFKTVYLFAGITLFLIFI